MVFSNKTEKSEDRAKSFERVYTDGKWFLNGESKSGRGSQVTASLQMIHILHQVVDEIKVRLGKYKIRYCTFFIHTCIFCLLIVGGWVGKLFLK